MSHTDSTKPPIDKRAALWQELEDYLEMHPEQAVCTRRIMHFVGNTPSCFERSHTAGHITGSAWLISPDGKRALLTLHRKLGKWLQPGGHADGEANLLRVAVREAQEESGIFGIEPVCTEIFDVDIHRIPARPQSQESAHFHYDVRYLLRAPHERFRISEESRALVWVDQAELLSSGIEVDESVRRMARKAQEML